MDRNGAAAPPRPAKPPGRAARVAPQSRTPLVTLTQPRPESERRLNTYVEAPPRGPLRPGVPQPPPPGIGGPGAGAKRVVTAQPLPGKQPRQPQRPACPQDSIMCSSCGRCRCADCAKPRSLPSRWLGDYCLCSAETAIDYSSCMCCAKALFYHCCDAENTNCADEPCSCTGSRRGARWGCLVALAFALPCLLCYWPLRGAAALCATAYARTGSSGCRCANRSSDKLPLQPPPPLGPPF